MSRNARLVLVLAITLLLQSFLVDALPIFGARLDLWIVVAVAGGLAAGPDRGAVFGFGIGLLYDVLLPSPLGLAALTGAVVAWLVGAFTSGLMAPSWWLGTMFGASMTAVGVGLFAVTGEVFGQGYVSAELPRIMFLVGLLSLIMAPVGIVVMRWCYQPIHARRVTEWMGSWSLG